MARNSDADLPILTDVVELRSTTGATGTHPTLDPATPPDLGLYPGVELDALQAELVSRALNLTDELLHGAAREMEAVMFERVQDRLRATLPELVELVLREHLGTRRD